MGGSAQFGESFGYGEEGAFGLRPRAALEPALRQPRRGDIPLLADSGDRLQPEHQKDNGTLDRAGG